MSKDLDMMNHQYQLDISKEKYIHGNNLHLQEQDTIFKAVFDYGLASSRSVMIVNGGGSIAMLTFLGHLFDGPNIHQQLASELALPLVVFLIGTALGAILPGIGYLSQTFFVLDSWHDQDRVNAKDAEKWWVVKSRVIGNVIRVLGVIVFSAGILCFLIAGFYAKAAFPIFI